MRKLRERDEHRKQGNKLASQNKLPEAIAEVEKALSIAREVLGDEHDGVIDIWDSLARSHEANDDFKAAIQAREQILAVRQRGPDEPAWKITDARLALEQSRQMAAWDRIRRVRYREALRLDERARGLRQQGKYQPALELAAQYEREIGDLLGENHRAYAAGLTLHANLFWSMGKYANAEPLYKQAMEIRKRRLGENHPDYAASLNNLAALYHYKGEYRTAEPLYQQAMQIRKRIQGENHPDYAMSLNNLAALYRSIGEYGKAEPLLLRAMDILKRTLDESHPNYALSLFNLGALYKEIGEYRKAEPLYQQAIEIQKRTLGDNHPVYAASLNMLAMLYYSTAEYGKAEPLFLEALEIRKRTLGENHPDYAASLNNLGALYSLTRDYRKAESLSQQAIELKKKVLGENHPIYARGLRNLAMAYLAQGRVRDAERRLTEAIAIDARWVADTLAVLGERQRFVVVNAQRASLDMYLTAAPQAGVAADVVYSALLDWRGAVESIHAEEGLVRDKPELRQTYEKLNQTRAQIASLAFRSPASAGQQEAWTKQMEALRTDKESLERELGLKSAADTRAKRAGRLSPVVLAALIPEGQALVDFFEYTHWTPPKEGKGRFKLERTLLAFVLRKGRATALVELGPAPAITQAVSNWRTALNTNPSAVDAAGRELARLVWEPLRPHIDDVNTILAAPDGALTGFPLGALPGQKPGTYLIEEKAIGYVSSGRALARLLSEQVAPTSSGRQPSGLLAAGAIDYAGDPGKAAPAQGETPLSIPLAKRDMATQAFQPLPGTGAEVEQIRRTFLQADPHGVVEVLTGAGATEGAIKGRIAQHPWRFVHLATHGFYESPRRLVAMLRAARNGDGAALSTIGPNDPEEQALGLLPFLSSGLALAGAERVLDEKNDEALSSDRAREDGLLTAEEVASLDLRGTDLVVLSACETGLGDVASGEGVLGLERAFQAAGAKSVVASLWRVSDPATSVLMEEFYKNLLTAKRSKLEALRQAQITVLHNPKLVRQREEELKRGPGPKPVALPDAGKITEAPARSSPAWWAAFVLSGDFR